MGISRQNKVVIPNKHAGSGQKLTEGAFEEVEIAAQISLPQDGGWAWVVLIASFVCYLIVDGVVFTFGSLLEVISKNLKVQDTWIALVNSIAIGIYYLNAPLASALINRFGFRVCGIIGSLLCCIGLFCSYLAKNFASLLIFNGIVTGLGCSLVNMSAGLVVGFYFEKLRGIAFAISSCGTSLGISLFFPLQAMLVKLHGWRTVMLLNSGIHGIIFFMAMTFTPLPSLTITNADVSPDDRTRTVTYLPSLSTAGLRLQASSTDRVRITNVERLFGTMSNSNFPTAANVIDPATTTAATQSQAGTSNAPSLPRISISTRGMSQRQIRQLKSTISGPNMQNVIKNLDEDSDKAKKNDKTCCGRLCHWESHPPDSRPMYRDDAFYEGDVTNLAIYRKSVVIQPELKTGLEYQMAVSRAVTANDLQDKKGICTTAFKRVLATMMDYQLLKRHSFQLYCFHGFFIYVGYMVPYIFLKGRNLIGGFPEFHCDYLISVIAISSVFGRVVLSVIAIKVDPVLLSAICTVIAGASTMMSGMSYSLAFQYSYAIIFGISSTTVNGLRSIVLVKLYGLENLTSSTGMYFIALGLGNIISTPLAGVIKNVFGYDLAFYVTGGCFILAGCAVFVMMIYERKEKKAEIAEAAQKNVQEQKITAKRVSPKSPSERPA